MEKLKWVCDQSFERDRAYGFAWPQRNYRCSFCKKEFKSAQALGGHMNVHRRDRARLRLSSPLPWDINPNSTNTNPNPNPNFPIVPSKPNSLPCNVASFHSSSFAAVTNNPASLFEENVSDHDQRGKKKKGGLLMADHDQLNIAGISRKIKDARVWPKNEFVQLDLNLGLIDQDVKEDLDLELRLGYS